MTDAADETHDYEDLAAALVAFDIDLEPAQVEQLDRYRQLLWSWNERMNLTRHTTFTKFVSRDVVDSLQLAGQLGQRQRVLDVGTGGGVPGLVLAICRPDLRVSLCESTQKKARAVQDMVNELNLPTKVFACRVEEVLQLETYDVLVARAVAPLVKLLGWLAPYWDAFDELLVVKGQSWVDERGEARHHGLLRPLELRKTASYTTRGNDFESVILRIWRPEAIDTD